MAKACRCWAAGVYQSKFTQVFNNKCDLRKPPTAENYEKIFEDGESSKSKLGVWFQLGCGLKKSAHQLLTLQQCDCWHSTQSGQTRFFQRQAGGSKEPLDSER